jgi:hypothetical protein
LRAQVSEPRFRFRLRLQLLLISLASILQKVKVMELHSDRHGRASVRLPLELVGLEGKVDRHENHASLKKMIRAISPTL